jgi:ankyrin repeat protein
MFQMAQHMASKLGWRPGTSYIFNDYIMESILEDVLTFILTCKQKFGLSEVRRFINTPTPETDQTMLTQACIHDQTLAARNLIKEGGADIYQQGRVGRKPGPPNSGAGGTSRMTPLGCAAYQGNLSLTQYLCREEKADPNTLMGNGRTALQYASIQGHAKVMRYLLGHGAMVDLTGEQGDTALMLASQSGQEASLQILLEHGASVERRTRDGNTALHLAANKGHIHILEILRKKGATLQKNKAGLTPMETAAWEGSAKIIEWFGDKYATPKAVLRRTFQLLITRSILQKHPKDTMMWKGKYEGLLKLGDAPLPPTENDITRIIEPRLPPDSTHASQKTYQIQECVITLSEILGPHHKDTLKTLQELAHQERRNQHFPRSLKIYSLILQTTWDQSAAYPGLAPLASRIKDLAGTIQVAHQSPKKPAWEVYKAMTSQTLERAMNLWETQHLLKSGSTFNGSQGQKRAWRMQMEELFWSTLELACIIVSQEGIRKHKDSLKLIHKYVTSNMKEDGGYGPLHALLIDRESKYNRRRRQRDTKIMREFLMAGADVNERNSSGHTMLHLATLQELDNLEEILDLGTQFGAHLDIKNQYGRSVLTMLRQKPEPIATHHQVGTGLAKYAAHQPLRLECLAATVASRTPKQRARSMHDLSEPINRLLQMHSPYNPPTVEEPSIEGRVKIDFRTRGQFFCGNLGMIPRWQDLITPTRRFH